MSRKKAAFIEVFGDGVGSADKSRPRRRRPVAGVENSRKVAFPAISVSKGGRQAAGGGSSGARRSGRLEPGCVAVRKDWLGAGIICAVLLLVVAFSLGNTRGRGATLRQLRAGARSAVGAGASRDADAATGGRVPLTVGGVTGRETLASRAVNAPARFYSLRVIDGISKTSAREVAAGLRSKNIGDVFWRSKGVGRYAVYVGRFEKRDDPRLAQLKESFAKTGAYKGCTVTAFEYPRSR